MMDVNDKWKMKVINREREQKRECEREFPTLYLVISDQHLPKTT